MKKNEILYKIGQIIKDLNDQYEYLSKTEDYNFLELELFSANANFLNDHLEILKKLNSLQIEKKSLGELNSTVINLPEKVTEESVKNLPLEDNDVEIKLNPQEIIQSENTLIHDVGNTDNNEMLFDFEQGAKIEDIYNRTLSEEENKIIQLKQQIIEPEELVHNAPFIIDDKNQTISNNSNTIVDSTIDQVKHLETPVDTTKENFIKPENHDLSNEISKPRTLNDKLSATQINSSPSRFAKIPSSDLKSIISLNDKLVFIKDLFNGYNLAYSEAIEILNRFDSFESADNFLQKNYADKNKWSDKQEVADRFYEILNRKYLK